MGKKLVFLILPVMMLALIFAAPATAADPPPSELPHYFYGAVTINGLPSPVGTTIAASGNGTLSGSFNPITTTEVGRYGSADPLANVARLLVQGNIADGDEILFYVNGYLSTAAAAWHSGQISELNIWVNIPIPPSSGSGGGGGGSSPPITTPAPPGSTVIVGLITSGGVFTQDVIIQDDDGSGTLTVNQNNAGLDANGQALIYLNLVHIEDATGLPAPETGNLVYAYEAGPRGAVFMPPATLEIVYPEGVIPDPGDYIAWWNGTSWIPLPSTVNNGSISASVSHFTRFALISGSAASTAPADLVLSDLIVSPAEAATNSIIMVKIKATNPAAVAVSTEIVLKLDGEVLARERVTLAAGTSQTLALTLTCATAGDHTVTVNDLGTTLEVVAK